MGYRPASPRVALILVASVSLGFAIAGGLALLSPIHVPSATVAFHGPLAVSAFFGTLIGLERAFALGRAWPYAAPLAAAAGGLVLLAGYPAVGFALMALGSLVLLGAGLLAVHRAPSLESAALAGAAGAWLNGNVMLFEGQPAAPWWIAFLVLAFAGERLKGVRRARALFAALALAVLFSPLFPPLLGVLLVLLALWLAAFGPARTRLRQPGRPRYEAACELAGDFWLAVGGVLVAASTAYDAALHAVFVGFAFSALFARLPVPYNALLYAPLVLLHASLAVRVFVSPALGAWGNASAMALFVASAAALLIRASSGRPIPRAPGR